jgi:hypothetical protein
MAIFDRYAATFVEVPVKLRVAILAGILLGTGCASTHMNQYMGKDIREVILDSGPPINAMDMGDGTRAFQFRWGGGTFAMPQTTTTSGTATSVGSSTWFQGQTISSGGGIVTSEGCVITYITNWNGQLKTWVVSAYRIPRQLVC